MKISQILFNIKAHNFADVDGELHADGALKTRVSFHDVILARDERKKFEIDER